MVETRNDETDRAKVVDPAEARQGVISGRVRTVLVVSLTLAVLALGILYLTYV